MAMLSSQERMNKLLNVTSWLLAISNPSEHAYFGFRIFTFSTETFPHFHINALHEAEFRRMVTSFIVTLLLFFSVNATLS